MLAFVAVLAIGTALVDAFPRGAPAVPAIAGLDAAVAVGVVDSDVATEMATRGEVDAFVVLNSAALLDAVRSAVPRLEDRGRALEVFDSLLRDVKARLAALLGDRGEVVSVLELLPVIEVRFRSEQGILALARSPLVEVIQGDREVAPTLAESLPLIGADEVHAAGYGGAGSYVAVLDTGVDAAGYPAFFRPGSVIEQYRAGDADGSALRAGHGTHVASTVLGVAPEARIIPVDVFVWAPGAKGPKASTKRILDGVAYVVNLKRQFLADASACCNVVAMNMSFGGGEHETSFCAESDGLLSAYLVGIIPVVSAGNDAVDEAADFHVGVGDPACSRYALSVGATTDGSRIVDSHCDDATVPDLVTWFSQTGPTLQILAPGSCIVAATGAKQGTSMAAPHVAGAVAVLAAASPSARIGDVWNALVASGPAITDVRTTPSTTVHRLDLRESLARLLGSAAGPDDPRTDTLAGYGLSPATAVLDPVGPGGSSAPATFLLRNSGGGPTTYHMTSSSGPGLAGGVASWVRFAPEELNLEAGQVTLVSVSVEVPPGAPAGTYEVKIGADMTDVGSARSAADPGSATIRFSVVDSGGPSGWIGWFWGSIVGNGLVRILLGLGMVRVALIVWRQSTRPSMRPA